MCAQAGLCYPYLVVVILNDGIDVASHLWIQRDFAFVAANKATARAQPQASIR